MPISKHTDANTTLQEIKDVIAAYQAERGWGKLSPSNYAMSIIIEAAELLEHFQWGDKDLTSQKQAMADELADVLTYCIEFALTTDIDISTAFHNKLERTKQKYPATIFNPENKASETYYRIKKEHRETKDKKLT